MSPDEYCQDKAARSGSSFYYSFLFLPPLRRRAITALYAFCREVDDVVDESTDAGLARTRLAWWRDELGRLYAGRPEHPVTRALQPHLEPFGIDRGRLEEIVDGMEMDLEQDRYLDFEGLRLYCHRVAGVVGTLSAGTFDDGAGRCRDYAEALGLALQLTNIIRDVGEDARRGRIYLPVAELQQFDVKAHEILQGRYSERFTALMRFQAERAERCYAEALALLPAADRATQKPGLMMASIYRTLLREIAHENFQVLHQRIQLTPLRKFWLAWKVQALGRM